MVHTTDSMPIQKQRSLQILSKNAMATLTAYPKEDALKEVKPDTKSTASKNVQASKLVTP